MDKNVFVGVGAVDKAVTILNIEPLHHTRHALRNDLNENTKDEASRQSAHMYMNIWKNYRLFHYTSKNVLLWF